MHDRASIRAALIEGLAEIKGVTTEEVSEHLEHLGDDDLLELDSKHAEWIIAHAELVLALRNQPPQPADLPKEQFATLGAIVDMLVDALQDQD